MDHEYLSVRAFAVRAGVSAQAIYKRLTNEKDELTTFLKEVDGKKTISTAALKLFQAEEAAETKNEGNSTSCQPVDNQLSTKMIEILQSELEAKNKQIEHLQQLLSQEQQLRLVADQRILMLTGGDGQEAQTEAEVVEPEQPETAVEQPKEQTQEQPKKHWWQFWK